MPGFDTITLLTDYGTSDEFVGVLKSVIWSIAPQVRIVDLCHEIAPFDVRGAGLMLARSAQYLCPGVVVAVVDPGVATARRAIAVEVGDGMSVLVGPDNGLLAPAVAMVGGASRAVELTNEALHLPAPGPTFAGRDVFAPIAAHLCNGVLFEQLGRRVDPVSLLPGLLPVSREEDGALVAEVLWTDRYGNLQLNVDPEEVDTFGEQVAVVLGSTRRIARRVETYGELRTGEVGLLVDSYGLAALVANRSSAAVELHADAGDQVRLERLDEQETATQRAASEVIVPFGRRNG
ncbi:MAG: SAM-dependent chlorinase/fluorinase [Acidimicrobiales bacterium]|nr:SAM-dependent chlorinase/fluorinase [Acidimicrobiales bacterium]